MICPYCNHENSRDDMHQYLGQSDHKYLTVRLLGRKCSNCGRDYTIEQVAVADDWRKPSPLDYIGDLFNESDALDSPEQRSK